MGYEQIRARLNGNAHQNTLSSFQNAFIAGASSGMVNITNLKWKSVPKFVANVAMPLQFAAVVTTPFDVIKTQRQVSSGRGKLEKILSMPHVLPMLTLGAKDAEIRRLVTKIIHEEGYKGFFRGKWVQCLLSYRSLLTWLAKASCHAWSRLHHPAL